MGNKKPNPTEFLTIAFGNIDYIIYKPYYYRIYMLSKYFYRGNWPWCPLKCLVQISIHQSRNALKQKLPCPYKSGPGLSKPSLSAPCVPKYTKT